MQRASELRETSLGGCTGSSGCGLGRRVAHGFCPSLEVCDAARGDSPRVRPASACRDGWRSGALPSPGAARRGGREGAGAGGRRGGAAARRGLRVERARSTAASEAAERKNNGKAV